jgi:hypothetical protein
MLFCKSDRVNRRSNVSRDGVTSRTVSPCRASLGSSVTISKDAEIARSGYPETADEDPRRAAEAVGLFISDTIAVSTAPGDFRSDDQLHRNATALPPRVTMSLTPSLLVGKSCRAGGGAGRGPAGTWVSTCDCNFKTSPFQKGSVLVPSA